MDEDLTSFVIVGSSFLRKVAVSRKIERRTFTEHKRNSIESSNLEFNERLHNKQFSSLLDR